MRGRILRYAIAVLMAALVAALTGMIAGCSSPGAANSGTSGDEPVRVGAILSLTGTYAALGTAERDALELQVARINAAGGVGGRQIQLIIEDDGTDEAKAVAAAQKLVNADGVVAILGATGTGPTMAVRQIVAEANVPQISMAGASVVTGDFSPNVYQTPWPNALIVSSLTEHLSAEGIGSIALVTDSGGYGKDGREVVLAAAEKAGIKVVLDTTFNPGDTDMTGQVSQVMRAKADAVVLWSAGKEAPLFVKAARTAGVTVPMFGGSGQARLEFVDGAGEAAEGYTIVTGRSFGNAWDAGSDEFTANKAFVDAFTAEYDHAPDIFAGHGYDAITLFADAANRVVAGGGTVDGASLIAALDQTKDVIGYAGRFTFSATDHNGLSADDVTLFTVSNGAFTAAR